MKKTRNTVFTRTHVTHGYNHDRLQGTYTGDDPTEQDIRDRFFEYFGGREVWVNTENKTWGCVVHGCD